MKPERPPRREPRDRGERRLLRDELDNSDIIDALEQLDEDDSNTLGESAASSAPPLRVRDDKPKHSDEQAARAQTPPRYQQRPGQRPPHPSVEAQDVRRGRFGHTAPMPEERSSQERADSTNQHRSGEQSEQRRSHQHYTRSSRRKEDTEHTREADASTESMPSPDEHTAQQSANPIHRRIRRRLDRDGKDRKR